MANNAMNFVFAIADALQTEDEERKHAGLEPLEDLQKYLPMIIPLDGTKKRTETIMAILEAHDRKWPHTFVVCSPVTTFEASRQSALFWTEVDARPVLWLDESDQAFSHESCPLLEQFKCLKDVGLAALQSTCREVVHVSATIENDIAYLWANKMAVRYHPCDVARAQQLGDEAGSGLHLHSVCREQEFTIEGMRKAGGLVLSGVRDAFSDVYKRSLGGMESQQVWWACCTQHRKSSVTNSHSNCAGVQSVIRGNPEPRFYRRTKKYKPASDDDDSDDEDEEAKEARKYWVHPSHGALCPNAVGFVRMSEMCGVFTRVTRADIKRARAQYDAGVEQHKFRSCSLDVYENNDKLKEYIKSTQDTGGRYLVWIVFRKVHVGGLFRDAYSRAAEWAEGLEFFETDPPEMHPRVRPHIGCSSQYRCTSLRTDARTTTVIIFTLSNQQTLANLVQASGRANGQNVVAVRESTSGMPGTVLYTVPSDYDAIQAYHTRVGEIMLPAKDKHVFVSELMERCKDAGFTAACRTIMEGPRKLVSRFYDRSWEERMRDIGVQEETPEGKAERERRNEENKALNRALDDHMHELKEDEALREMLAERAAAGDATAEALLEQLELDSDENDEAEGSDDHSKDLDDDTGADQDEDDEDDEAEEGDEDQLMFGQSHLWDDATSRAALEQAISDLVETQDVTWFKSRDLFRFFPSKAHAQKFKRHNYSALNRLCTTRPAVLVKRGKGVSAEYRLAQRGKFLAEQGV